MNEPSSKKLKVAVCVICYGSGYTTDRGSTFTKLLINQLIPPEEQKGFPGTNLFDFCVNCIEILEDLYQLQIGMEYIQKNIARKVGKIKLQILKHQYNYGNTLIENFRRISTKDFLPRVQMNLNNKLSSVRNKRITEDNIQSISKRDLALPPEKIVSNAIEPTSQMTNNIPVVQSKITVSRSPSSSSLCDNENEFLSASESAEDSFDQAEQRTSSPLGKYSDDKVRSEVISMQISEELSFQEEETVAKFEPWHEESITENNVFMENEIDNENEQFEEVVAEEVEILESDRHRKNGDDSNNIVDGPAPNINRTPTKMRTWRRFSNEKSPNTVQKWRKPPFTTSELCVLAVMTSEGFRMRAMEVFKFISENFPFFNIQRLNWKGNVRVTLSNRSLFSGVPAVKRNRSSLVYAIKDNEGTQRVRKNTGKILQNSPCQMAFPERISFFQDALMKKIPNVTFILENLSSGDECGTEFTNSEDGTVEDSPSVPDVYQINETQICCATMDINGKQQSPVTWHRPPLAISQLCLLAIMTSESMQMRRREIHAFIVENFPYYQLNGVVAKMKYDVNHAVANCDCIKGVKNLNSTDNKKIIYSLTHSNNFINQRRRLREKLNESYLSNKSMAFPERLSIFKVAVKRDIPKILELRENTLESDLDSDVEILEINNAPSQNQSNKNVTNTITVEDETEISSAETVQSNSAAQKKKVWERPLMSYLELTLLSILTSVNMKMKILQIFDFISENFPYYKFDTSNWRTNIRNVCHAGCISHHVEKHVSIFYVYKYYSISPSGRQYVECMASLRTRLKDKLLPHQMAFPERLTTFQNAIDKDVSNISHMLEDSSKVNDNSCNSNSEVVDAISVVNDDEQPTTFETYESVPESDEDENSMLDESTEKSTDYVETEKSIGEETEKLTQHDEISKTAESAKTGESEVAEIKFENNEVWAIETTQSMPQNTFMNSFATNALPVNSFNPVASIENPYSLNLLPTSIPLAENVVSCGQGWNWPKPLLSYEDMCVLTILNSENLLVTYRDVYSFTKENFPFFKVEVKESHEYFINATLNSPLFAVSGTNGNVFNGLPLDLSFYTINWSVMSDEVRVKIATLLSTRENLASMAFPERVQLFIQKVLTNSVPNALNLH